MRRFFQLAVTLGGCLVLSSCFVFSTQADPGLVGDWPDHDKSKGVTHIAIVNAHEMRATHSPGDEPPASYEIYPTVVDGQKFLSVELKEQSGHDTEVHYVFVRYEISKDGVLRLWFMDQDKTEAAVRAGKLKGDLEKNGSQAGNPPRPDFDVLLTDSSAKMTEFIRGSGAKALFDQASARN